MNDNDIIIDSFGARDANMASALLALNLVLTKKQI